MADIKQYPVHEIDLRQARLMVICLITRLAFDTHTDKPPLYGKILEN